MSWVHKEQPTKRLHSLKLFLTGGTKYTVFLYLIVFVLYKWTQKRSVHERNNFKF